MKPIDLSLVLTLYNEGSILSENLARIDEVLRKSGLAFEIIFVDDKSQDNSVAEVKAFMMTRSNCLLIEHKENIGRGGSVSDGIKMARGKAVGFIDTDLEIYPDKIPEAVQTILAGEAEIVTGLRTYPFFLPLVFRYILTKGYQLLVRLVLTLPLKDTETGFKFFNREKILPILERVRDKRWFWDTEIMALSFNSGLRIKEIPVVFKRCFDKKSTVKVFRDSVNYFKKLIEFKKRK